MKNFFPVMCGLCVLAIMPGIASAHERQVFDVNGTKYLFIVGSLNEPVAVDDKSGVDLRIVKADPADLGNSSASGAKPVEALDQTLKVEISAGAKKKIMNLTPGFRDPGAYRAVFFPTVKTTYAYRVFGELDSAPFDVTFVCNPAGHPAGAENKEVLKISDKVSRVLQVGSFGCPSAKEELGFPESAPSLADLSAHIAGAMSQISSTLVANRMLGLLALLLAVVAVGLSIRKKM